MRPFRQQVEITGDATTGFISPTDVFDALSNGVVTGWTIRQTVGTAVTWVPYLACRQWDGTAAPDLEDQCATLASYATDTTGVANRFSEHRHFTNGLIFGANVSSAPASWTIQVDVEGYII